MKRNIETTAALVSMVMLLPMMANAKGESGGSWNRDRSAQTSRINQDRVEIGRALIEVQSSNWPSVVPYEAKGMSIIKFLPNGTSVYYQRDYYTEGDIMANIPGLDEAILGFRNYYKCAVDPTFPCPF